MSDSSVIADVSATLQAVLTHAFSTLLPAPPPVAEVHDLHGAVSTSPARMTISLFNIMEDATLRNRPPTRDVAPPNLTSTRSPVPLVLRFLLAPWSGDRLTEHRILGRALQALHDGAIISGPQLQGGLAGTSEALKLKLAPLSLEEQTRYWTAVQLPYRLSVTYDVRVIKIDATDVDTHWPVTSRAITGAIGDGA